MLIQKFHSGFSIFRLYLRELKTLTILILKTQMKKTFSFLLIIALLPVTASFGQNQNATEIIITKTDLAKADTSIPVALIGEPVGSVKLYEPRWVEATENSPAYGVVEGSIFPVDPNGWPINFRVLLPANWSQRAIRSLSMCAILTFWQTFPPRHPPQPR